MSTSNGAMPTSASSTRCGVSASSRSRSAYMPPLIKDRAVIADRWTLLREATTLGDIGADLPVIVPLALWQAERAPLLARDDERRRNGKSGLVTRARCPNRRFPRGTIRGAACPSDRVASMPLPLFRLPPGDQRDWLVRALARPAPPAARNLSDGFRLPGREGTPKPAAVL